MANVSSNKSQRFAFSVATSLFFIFGFITCLNDILVPHLKALFTLDYTHAALVQFCFFTAYFISSLPSGKLVGKVGYKKGAIIGLVITAVGCLLFYPAAGMASYNLFLFGLFVLASGITLMQVAVNPYIAILGPPETSSARLNLAQAFNSLGTTIAPAVGAYLILSSVTTDAKSVQGPYIGLAITLLVLAGIMGMMHLPSIPGSTEADATTGSSKDLSSAWEYRHLVLGALAIFFYVGAEVAIGSYLVNFLGLSDVAGLSEKTAAQYVSLYWGGAMVGRFIGAAVLRVVSPGKVLGFNAVVASVLVMIAMAFGGPIAMWSILAVGLFNSIMFPTIFTLAIKGLGKNTGQGSGILCMAIVGGAIIPLIQGGMADHFGLHHGYLLPVLCYVYIAYYGVKGSRFAIRAMKEKAVIRNATHLA